MFQERKDALCWKRKKLVLLRTEVRRMWSSVYWGEGGVVALARMEVTVGPATVSVLAAVTVDCAWERVGRRASKGSKVVGRRILGSCGEDAWEEVVSSRCCCCCCFHFNVLLSGAVTTRVLGSKLFKCYHFILQSSFILELATFTVTKSDSRL